LHVLTKLYIHFFWNFSSTYKNRSAKFPNVSPCTIQGHLQHTY